MADANATTIDALNEVTPAVLIDGKFTIVVEGSFTGTITPQFSSDNSTFYDDTANALTAPGTLFGESSIGPDGKGVFWRVKATAWTSGTAYAMILHTGRC